VPDPDHRRDQRPRRDSRVRDRARLRHPGGLHLRQVRGHPLQVRDLPSWGLSQKLSRLIGANRAREVSLTALPVDAASAQTWGLVNRTVPPDQLLPTAKRIASAIASNHAEMVLNYKRVINDGLALPLGEARALEKERAWAYYKDMKPEDFQQMQKFIARRARPKL